MHPFLDCRDLTVLAIGKDTSVSDRISRLGHRAYCTVLACLKDRRGQNLVEHSMLIGVLALAAAFGLSKLSENIRVVLINVQEVLEQQLPPSNGNCGNPNPGTQGGQSPCAP